MLYDEFPAGLEVWTAGGEIALKFAKGAMDDHVSHVPCDSGEQARIARALAATHLPIQKVLNATISLYDRYFRAVLFRVRKQHLVSRLLM